MTVKLSGGEEIKIWFERNPGATNTVVVAQYASAEYRATAELSKHDAFVKATGRRVALTKILRGLSRFVIYPGRFEWRTARVFSREDRRLVWAEYFRTHADLRRAGRKRALPQ